MANDRHMISSTVGSVVIAVHTSEPPSPTEWTEFLGQLRQVPQGKLGILVFTDGGRPDVNQRAQLNQLGLKPRIAVVAANPLVRTALTAISWFNPYIRPFSPADAGAGLDYLGIAAGEHAAVLVRARQMAAGLAAAVGVLTPRR